MTEEQRKAIDIENEMLKGNINRMCVTDDEDELAYMRDVAIRRIQKIHLINSIKLEEERRRKNETLGTGKQVQSRENRSTTNNQIM